MLMRRQSSKRMTVTVNVADHTGPRTRRPPMPSSINYHLKLQLHVVLDKCSLTMLGVMIAKELIGWRRRSLALMSVQEVRKDSHGYMGDKDARKKGEGACEKALVPRWPLVALFRHDVLCTKVGET